MKKNFLLIIIGCFLIISSGCTNPSTPAGHEGYVKENPRVWGKGGFRGAMKGPANYGVSLWRNEVENVDMRPQTYPESFKILTKDELNVSFRFQTIIKVKPGTIKTVVEEFAGKDFYQRYIKEPLRSMVRKNVQNLESREVKEKRKEISEAVLKEIKEYLKETPFIVISGVVGNIDYPDVVTKAVEKKLAAKQLLDEKATQKEIAKKDAEIRIEEARGIAEAQKIINSTLTKNYLQHEAINAQLKMASSPNHTTVYIPSGANGIPIVETIK
ncbi:SPFH domain-containing protein [Desulfonema limicola]|uniref:SPFH domain-containing protein n=1 Tax=Desulfonema limicola TaxID=45656 RepID=A0A975B888_9BACT|nr:SPFH domain-containing protein [Desulfonema limicola]QTA80809.1 SPFH domain-containing protein [Desulfonema limicola]